MCTKFNLFKLPYLALFIFSLAIACQPIKPKEEKVILIKYEVYGGEMGKTYGLSLQKNSINLFNRLSDHDTLIKHRAVTLAEWKKALNYFHVDDLKKIKSGKSNAPLDGKDIIITIATNKYSYQLVNAETDFFNYWRIRKLVKYLQTLDIDN